MPADFSVLSRRKLLALSTGAGAFLFMGGAGGLVALRGRAPAVAGLRALSDHEHRTLAALVAVLFPSGGAIPSSGADAGLARMFDGFLADEPEWNRSDLKKALFLLEFGPVLYDRRFVTFSHLPEAERLAHFQSWAESDSLLRRQVAIAFRKFLSLVFYDRPEVWPHIGYPGPFVRQESSR